MLVLIQVGSLRSPSQAHASAQPNVKKKIQSRKMKKSTTFVVLFWCIPLAVYCQASSRKYGVHKEARKIKENRERQTSKRICYSSDDTTNNAGCEPKRAEMVSGLWLCLDTNLVQGSFWFSCALDSMSVRVPKPDKMKKSTLMECFFRVW